MIELLTMGGVAWCSILLTIHVYSSWRRDRQLREVLINLCEAVAEMYEITHGDANQRSNPPQSRRTMHSPPRSKP